MAIRGSADKELSAALHAGERLGWSGRPRLGIHLGTGDALSVPLSCAWLGFALHWERHALRVDDGGFFAACGLAFVVAGMHLVFGRFVSQAIRRRNTCYGLTDERAIIVSGTFSRQVLSLDLQSLDELTMSERQDGSGSICFGAVRNMSAGVGVWLGSSWPGVARHLPPAFEMVEDVRTVYEKIRVARRTRG